MTYLMSDLHGQYDKYRKMLDKIGFSDKDDLFILGDVVDRGPKPMACLRDMSLRANVFPILGNCDWMARTLLPGIAAKDNTGKAALPLHEEYSDAVRLWLADGGTVTLKGFMNLSAEEQEAILGYLGEFSPYEEIEVNGIRYVLVHAGLDHFSPEKPLGKYDEPELCTGGCDYGRRYFSGRILVTGHTPTFRIAPSSAGRIWRGNGHIALDCGAGFGLPLGCLRLEDGKEFYVE